jgi:hypothetical protein
MIEVIKKKRKKDPYWGKPYANLMRETEKLLGVGLDDKDFAEKFLETQCIDAGPFLIHKDIYQQYLKVQENKIPCGYIWFDISDLKEEMIGLKNGQASTGDVYKRLKDYPTRGKQILLDILEDNVFTQKNYDQKLNKEIHRDYYRKYRIKVEDSKTVRTRENVLVPRSLLFDFPQLKRNTLGRLLNKTINKRTFHASVSHENCLKKLTKNSNQQFFLLDCVMRFGKSFIYYEYLKREWVDKGKVGIHTVFCHDTKTVDGWLNKAEIYYTNLFNCVELKKDKSFDFNQKVEKNTIVFISQQLLHSNKDNSNPDETYIQPLQDLITFDVKCDTTFVDEVHQYFSPKWKSYFESITKGRIILASGTAAKIKLTYTDLFDEDNTHTDTLKDLKDRLFREFGIDVITRINQLDIKKLGSEFTSMGNLQSIENGKLVNPALGYKFCDAIFKGYRTSAMTQEQIDPNNPKHCPIYVDTVEFGKLIFQYLTNNPQLNIVPIMVAGSSKERTVKTETELKDFINDRDSEGKSTVMITCGSMIQGVSVEEWKDMINLSVVGTYEMFYQFFGRGWEIDTTKMKGEKIEITMWDYNPQRTLKVAAQFVQSLAMTNGKDIPKAFQYFFQIHNIFDYVKEGSSFREVDEVKIQSEIRKYIDSQVLTRGCKARLVTNTRPEVMSDVPNELLETLLKTQGLKPSNRKIKELKSYKNDISKQKSNYSKKSHDLDIPKIPKGVQDCWQSAIDGLSVYTERIPIVTEGMFNQGKLKTKNVIELMSKSQDESFVGGFKFPNSIISQQFADYIMKHGNIGKINNKVDNSVNLIPIILECLDMSRDEFLKVGDTFDKMYKYGGDDTQLSVENWISFLEKWIKKLKLNQLKTFHFPCAKSGSAILAFSYLLKENSTKIFGRELTNQEIIESVSYEDENPFFESLMNIMGFSKSTKTKKDFIVINPPYSSGLHLDIFVKSFNDELNDDGTLICVHRETPVITKTPNPNKKTKEYRDIMLNNTSKITFFDGNEVFTSLNDAFRAPLIISTVTKDSKKSDLIIKSNHLKNPYKYSAKSFDDVYIHSDVEKTIRIREKLNKKIIESSLSNLNKMSTKKNQISPYFVNIKQIGGHSMIDGKINKDFYCLIPPTFENSIGKYITNDIKNCLTKKGRGGAIRANSYNESLNLFSYLKTKFVRFAFSLTKIDQNIWDGDMISVIPYMDFTKTWDDVELFKYFELEDDLIEYINEYIEPIYDYEKSN